MRSLVSLSLLATGLNACASTGAPEVPVSAPASAPAAAAAPVPAPAAPTPPVAAKKPVTDTYHGTTVAEDYRWLEDWSDPDVKAWSSAQNTYARSVLDGLPGGSEVAAELGQILKTKAVRHFNVSVRGEQVFAIRRQPPKQQGFLVVMDGLEAGATARVLVDPNAIDPSGKTHLDWYAPSPNGKIVAVSLSKGGTESGDVHLYDVVTGKPTGEIVERVQGGTAGGDLAWNPDGKGFFYTRYPRAGERTGADLNFYQQLYYHPLGGDPAKDRYELGKDLPRIAEIQLEMHDKTGLLLVTVQKGDGGEFRHYLRGRNGRYKKLSEFGDGIIEGTFGPRNDLYFISTQKAPRGKIVRTSLRSLNVKRGKLVVREGKDTIVSDFWSSSAFKVTKNRLFVTYQTGGPSEIRVFDLRGRKKPAPDQMPISSVGSIVRLGGDDILFANESYVQPSSWFRFEARTAKTTPVPLNDPFPVTFGAVTVKREMATSKDGTKVPVNILLPEGTKMDGNAPCVVYGYGGYGVNLTPRFRPSLKVLLDRGVVYAVANLRGGGEFGEQWHRQGYLTNKQNVFDDFAAAAQHLIDRGYTKSSRMAILGRSNGGLLMGATLTQHPELAKAVVAGVGIYDMLRVELSPNGAFNVTEFGTVKDPKQFAALYAYSPYHNVKDGVRYPSVLFTTGENDPRVDPMQSRKMTARLQAASPDSRILLRTSSGTGHGGGTGLDERIAELAHTFAFIMDELGVAVTSTDES